MRSVRVGLVGSGYIAHYHARALQDVAGAGVQVVCSVDREQAEEFAKTYRIAEVVEDVNLLFGREDLQAVILCTPNALHAPHATVFLEQGKDVLIEKPMAISTESGRSIGEAAARRGRIVMVGHMWRFDAEVNYVREAVQAGRLGRIVKTKGYGIHEDWGPTGWFTQPELAGGGALADMGVHAIDTVRYLLGDPRPRQVYARIGRYFGDYEVDDTGIVVITWEDEVMSVIESGWWHPHADGPEAGTRLFGTEGYASVFPTELKLKGAKGFETTRPSFPARKEHCDQVIYTRQMGHFIDCVRRRTTPRADWRVGQTVVEIVEAAYASAQSGGAVAL